MEKSLQFICYTDYEWLVATFLPSLLTSFYTLYPYATALQVFFLHRTGRPLCKALCRDTMIFEVIILLETIWYIFFLQGPLDKVRNALNDTLSTHKTYYKTFAESPVSQPYFFGFLMIAVSFRFYFALKATRIFGPFTKLIKINAVNLFTWLIFTIILLLVSSNSL